MALVLFESWCYCMNEISIAIRNVFPFMTGEEIVRFIEQIQDQLCPTCMENQDYDPGREEDCPFRPKYVSAQQIHDGEISESAAEHWLGALLDAKGALITIAIRKAGAPLEDIEEAYWCQANRHIFCRACARAQSFMEQGYDWTNVQSAPGYDGKYDDIGMAYKLAADGTDGNPADPLYIQMYAVARPEENNAE